MTFASTITSWSSRSSVARGVECLVEHDDLRPEPPPSSSVTIAILPRREVCDAQRRDDAGDEHRLLPRLQARRAAGGRAGASSGANAAYGMPRQVEPERGLLVREPLGLGPLARRDEREPGLLARIAEQRHLRGRAPPPSPPRSSATPTDAKSVARRGSIASNAPPRTSASTARRLTCALVDAPAEIEEVAERAARVARARRSPRSPARRCP